MTRWLLAMPVVCLCACADPPSTSGSTCIDCHSSEIALRATVDPSDAAPDIESTGES